MRARNAGKWVAAGAALMALRARATRGYELKDRAVLITGSSRGLGLVLARQLLAEGARVALTGRDEETLLRARQELAAEAPGRVLALPCDVGDFEQVKTVVEGVIAAFGRLDVVINNAGQIQMGPVEEMTLEDFETQLRVHFWGPLHTTLAALEHLRASGDGRILNVVSIGGKVAVPHLLPYSASKFALAGLSEGLRAELSPHGVKVISVFPGLMRTGSPRNAAFKGQHRQEYFWFKTADSLPGLTLNAERAAKKMLGALKRGDAEVVLSAPAKAAALVHGLFPGLTSRLMTLAHLALPRPGGVGTRAVPGRESESAASEGWFNTLTDRAAERNNETPAG